MLDKVSEGRGKTNSQTLNTKNSFSHFNFYLECEQFFFTDGFGFHLEHVTTNKPQRNACFFSYPKQRSSLGLGSIRFKV